MIDFHAKNNFQKILLDARGLIKGEYGFITADNVYHVTEYATDEDGNFKIISMRNIKLHQLSDHDLAKSDATTLQPFTVKTTVRPTILTTTLLPSTRGETCASCKLPPTKRPESVTSTTASSSTDENSTIPPPFKIVGKDDTTLRPQTTTQQVQQQQKIVVENKNQQLNTRPPLGNSRNDFHSFQSGNFNPQPQQQSSNDLLYRFDYATDFQGHKEEGDHSGNKYGEYFSVGRDNVKRIVSYKANENGFMPQIRQQPISLNELRQYDETNNKLRHNNFEWFYPSHSHIFG